ncbi:MAG: sugar transporter [Treponema sp. CETP13]|nr:MAG: sugar transporter [Treponema sp. CETP13]
MDYKQNRYTFGLGTVGRDMVYSLIAMYLIYYLTDILSLPDNVILQITTVIIGARIFDALNDPVMGTIIDNTKTRWGKFKPWIIIGAFLSGVLTILLFTGLGVNGSQYVLIFSIFYVLWGMAYTVNDISFWSMLPALSSNQKEREKIGSIARICANIGTFTVVAGIVPITAVLEKHTGSMSKAYTIFAIGAVSILWIFQSITIIGTKVPAKKTLNSERTSLKGMIKVIFKNDQLLFIAISMTLFMIGYLTTTSFGLYFFKYAYGNEGMYTIFAVILGISQISALILFPIFSNKWTRKQLYTTATIGVAIGYVIFFISPMNMIPIGFAGVLIFFSEGLIQILCLVFLTDTVEYGEWKFGKRNESITFSIQPLIYKLSGAIASGITGIVVVFSGINAAKSAADVSTQGLWIMKAAMLIFPLFMFLLSYIVYRTKYIIDSKMYNKILEDLKDNIDKSSK